MTHSERKTHVPPLPAAGSAPAPCLLGEVPLVSLQGAGAELLFEVWSVAYSMELVRTTRTRCSGVFVSIYK